MLSRKKNMNNFLVVKKTAVKSHHTIFCRMASKYQIGVDYLQSENFHQLSGGRLLSVVRDTGKFTMNGIETG